MATYIFTIDDGVHPIEHHEMELSNLEEVRFEASRFFGAMIIYEPHIFWRARHWRLNVSGPEGRPLIEMHALAIEEPAGVPVRLSI